MDDELKREIAQVLRDQDAMAVIRFEHLDSRLDELKNDQKAAQANTLERIKEMIALYIENITALVNRQDEKIDRVQSCIDEQGEQTDARFLAVDVKIKELRLDVDSLKKAPTEKAAGIWNKIKDKLLWGFLGLLLSGLTAGIIKIITLIEVVAKQ